MADDFSDDGYDHEDFNEDFPEEEEYEHIEIEDDDYDNLVSQSQMSDESDLSNKRYCRPPVDYSKVNEKSDFYFMLLDADYFVMSSKNESGQNNKEKQSKTKNVKGSAQKEQEDFEREPIVRMFGSTKDQHSVLINIRGVVPYLYVRLPPGIIANQNTLNNLKVELNRQGKTNIQDQICLNNFIQRIIFQCRIEILFMQNLYQYIFFQNTQKGLTARNVKTKHFIKNIEAIKGESIKFYKGKNYQPDTFLKIYTFIPSFVPTLRGIFEGGFKFDNVLFPSTTFESNIPFALRYMIDANIVGMGWVKLDKNKFQIRSSDKHKSRCQIEIDVNYQNVHNTDPTDPNWASIAPLRIFSFDIECLALNGGFPNSQKDPIIQISTVLKIHDQQEDIVRTVFTKDSCANIPGCIVKCFSTEQELLMEWEKFMQTVDPDIYLGYNITNFDFPYIIERGQVLKINNNKVQLKQVNLFNCFDIIVMDILEELKAQKPGQKKVNFYQKLWA